MIMNASLTVLALLGLSSFVWSVPLPSFGGRMNEVRDALEHVNKVRSELRRSLDLAEENSKSQSMVRGLELPGRSLLGTALDTMKKSTEFVKRHIELNERDQDNDVLRKAAETIKRTAENLKLKRNEELSKRSCGVGLGFCNPEMEEKKREENTAVRDVKEAVDGFMQKRSEDGFLQNTMNTIKKSAEMAKRHVEEEELKKRNSDGAQRALRDVAEELRKRACGVGLGFCGPESMEDFKRSLSDVGKTIAEFQSRHLEGGKREEEKEPEDEEEERSLFNMARDFKRAADVMIQKSEQADDERALRSLFDNMEQASDKFQQKRDAEEVMKTLKKRACGVGLGFCGPEAEQESKREEDIGEVFRRNPMAASMSAVKGVEKKDEEWMRNVREILDNKVTQIRETVKGFPAYRAAPDQV